MNLLLTSAGFKNKSIAKALTKLAGKPFSELNLAFIPTAANVEVGGKEWLIDDLVNCKNLGFKNIEIIDFSAIPKDIWLPELKKADVLLFGGGNTFHLMYCLEKFGLKKLLKGLLKDKVYVGISAGSMVIAKNLALSQSNRLYSEQIGKLKDNEGLGFVNLHIRPHLNSPFFPKVRLKNIEKLAKELKDPVYALDDESAVVVDDNKVHIVSEGKWRLFK